MTRQPKVLGVLIAAILASILLADHSHSQAVSLSVADSAPDPVRRIDQLLAQARELEGRDLQQSLHTAEQALDDSRGHSLTAYELASLLQVSTGGHNPSRNAEGRADTR